jgi:hypothetical protein
MSGLFTEFVYFKLSQMRTVESLKPECFQLSQRAPRAAGTYSVFCQVSDINDLDGTFFGRPAETIDPNRCGPAAVLVLYVIILFATGCHRTLAEMRRE